MDVPVDVTPVSAPPVALKIPVGFPLPSPIKNASSSFVPILLPNSLEMYCSILNTLSFKSSSDTLIMVASLKALMVVCPKLSSDSGN